MYCPNKVRTPPVTSTSSGASGYVGETTRVSISGNSPNLTAANIATFTLTAGVFSVEVYGTIDVQNAATHTNRLSLSLTSAAEDTSYQVTLAGNSTTLSKAFSLKRIVNTTGQNVFFVCFQNGSATTPIAGYAVITRIA